MGLLSRLFGRRYQPARAIAYKQGDPPPPHIAEKCAVIFEGGAAKMPSVVDKEGNYSAARLVMSQLRGYPTDEHCWIWLKPEQLVRYDPARIAHELTRREDISEHIQEMCDLRRPDPVRVDLVNEPLSPLKGEYLKQHPDLVDQVNAYELAYYFRIASWSRPDIKFAVNEWGCETSRERAQNLLRLWKELAMFNGAPQVIGLQCHLKEGDDLATLDWLCGQIRALPNAPEIYFTELDISAPEPEQERLAKELMQIAQRHKVTQVTLWHWRDKNHWRPGAAPFDEAGKPKRWAKILGYA